MSELLTYRFHTIGANDIATEQTAVERRRGRFGYWPFLMYDFPPYRKTRDVNNDGPGDGVVKKKNKKK